MKGGQKKAGSVSNQKDTRDVGKVEAKVAMAGDDAAGGLGRWRWHVLGAVAVLWAVLFLPGLRTNPNWYGDEGEWMEKCWTFAHGTPRVGPVVNDFVFPYPYPPLYMAVNGVLLRVFGNDIVVGRGLGAVTALAAAGLLFWLGSRLRDERFGVLCVVAFLVYGEAVMNFRWVRSHPMAGTLALASMGFLVRYVQEKKLRDAVLAGVMCSLATATNYFAYPLIGAVIVTVAVVNWRHAPLAAACAGAYGAMFVLWYMASYGWGELMAQVGRLGQVASNEVRPTWWGEVKRFVMNVWTLGFRTPTHGPPPGWSGRDYWLVLATLGMVWLPVRKNPWMRAWVVFWLLALMYGVFKKLNNVPLFFYPATMFLPLMAVGMAGLLTWACEGMARWEKQLRWAPAVVVLGWFGLNTVGGAWGHFESKIDVWTQSRGSVLAAEKAARIINENTTADDVVIVPKQVYWLVSRAKKTMLSHCVSYAGRTNAAWPVAIPAEKFWFDADWRKAKYALVAAGRDPVTGGPVGIDAVYTVSLEGVREILMEMFQSWSVVMQEGEYVLLANPKLVNGGARPGIQ